MMMRGLVLAAALICAGWLSVTPAPAVTLRLDSGETFEGAIIHATRNTLTIRPAIGGIRQIPVGRLEQVQATTADGQTLRGRYHGWAHGRAGIEVGSEVLWLENDRVVARTSLAPPVLAEGGPPAPAEPMSTPAVEVPAREPAETWSASESVATEPASVVAETEPASAYAAIEPAIASAVTEPASPPAPARPDDRTAASVVAPMPAMPVPEPAAGAETVALPQPELPAVRVTVAPDEVTEKSGEIVFTLELSRPIDDLLVVIYSTVDGAAHAGADYQASQGIVSLLPGATREQLRTTVLDDGEAEGDEEFQLFVATNPDLTEVAQQWLRVTIHDDD
jgi:Calx-beta domain